MSRRRKLKKQRKRRARWVEGLEDLYLRQADDAFLEAARPHFRELESASVAGLYGEVAGRALAGALTGGDPARVGQLLAGIRRDVAPRPLVLLAEAVDLLAEGRREPAAARLAALDAAGEAVPDVVRHLPRRLRLLAGSGDVPARSQEAGDDALWQEIAEVARLERALEAHVVPGKGLPRSLRLEDPATRAVWDVYRALTAVGQRSFRPGAKTLEALAKAVAALRDQGPVDAPLGRLLRETDKRLKALAAVHKLEQTMRRSRRPRLEELLLERLSTARGLTNRLLGDDPPALLRPLQQALRTRWRGVLELVFERRGAEGLSVLLAARPEVLRVDLGAGAAEVEQARTWAAAEALLESESFGELASFLKAAETGVETPQRLAALWSLELWARREEGRDLDHKEAHRTLVRVIEMAAAIDNRFAAAEWPQVARFLRGELVELCEVLFFCDHFLDAAEALLEYLVDDAGLLAVALAAAVSSRNDRARDEYAVRVAARGPAPAERDGLLRVVESIAAERPVTAMPALTALRPLFTGDDWSEVLDRVAPEAVDTMLAGLAGAAEIADQDPEEAEWILGAVRRDLDLCRPLLGERPELAALEVTVESWGAGPAAAQHVQRFLGRFASLGPALMLYRQAVELRDTVTYPDVDAAVVEAVVDRLDHRWRAWVPYLEPLVDDATPEQLRRLGRKARRWSKDKTLDEGDRESLRQIAKAFGKISRLKRMLRATSVLDADFELPELESFEAPEPRPRKPRRPRPADERQLDLFALE